MDFRWIFVENTFENPWIFDGFFNFSMDFLWKTCGFLDLWPEIQVNTGYKSVITSFLE